MGDPGNGTQMRTKLSLTKLSDECPADDPLAPFQESIRGWASTYLVAPHPELGRAGPVCPYTAASIGREMFWVGCDSRFDLTEEDIEQAVSGAISEFDQPQDDPIALLKTVTVLFPGVRDYTLIDRAQRLLKEAFIAKGLMIGQFYPGCTEPGIRNPDFRPLQSPVPLLAVRHMVASDFPFLAAEPKWVEGYLRKFSPAIPAFVREMIAEKFQAPCEQVLQESNA